VQFTDKPLECADCGATFTFTVGEQEFYSTKGFTNEPRRCPTCRSARKQDRGGFGGGGSAGRFGAPRQMYSITCAQCGREAEVPFEPRQGRPVYCNDCFSRERPARY
jgi:CxxC-x17-CxxC domain-containing protein